MHTRAHTHACNSLAQSRHTNTHTWTRRGCVHYTLEWFDFPKTKSASSKIPDSSRVQKDRWLLPDSYASYTLLEKKKVNSKKSINFHMYDFPSIYSTPKSVTNFDENNPSYKNAKFFGFFKSGKLKFRSGTNRRCFHTLLIPLPEVFRWTISLSENRTTLT